MSKKRKGRRPKRDGRAARCAICGGLAKASAKVKGSREWAQKAGTIGLPREGTPPRRRMSPEEAFECAKAAGIYDEDGNLTPTYR